MIDRIQVSTQSDRERFLEEVERERRLASVNHAQDANREFSLSQVPDLYRGKTWDDFTIACPKQQFVKHSVQRYVAHLKQNPKADVGLIFSGQCGTGKTLLSMILLQTLIPMRIRYEADMHFLHQLQEKIFHSGEYKNQMSALQDAPLLILDEINCGFKNSKTLSPFEKQRLFELIDARYRQKRPTILITNSPIKELKGLLDDAIYSRLYERNLILEFGWQSYRTQPPSQGA